MWCRITPAYPLTEQEMDDDLVSSSRLCEPIIRCMGRKGAHSGDCGEIRFSLTSDHARMFCAAVISVRMTARFHVAGTDRTGPQPRIIVRRSC
ncbi:MAG: hypothetical protein ACLVAT_02600 [Lachnospiraceae bacterium]